ncbi:MULTISPECIES: oxygen-independent coproporphyrinogen III oxidase [unclassified Duganella]|uniref:oxygen-independent coproporphyrinogen III oxidase n=1 Tax=unclassified Duganella TaxID=2636909 RepID=UPI000884E142|nr:MULTISPECIES: oxygen-independent coproporphyrinogen III oxidase [unclassified Duganella]SDG42343.1 oxygen-independent coproporphyrinogen-3 oxidase [Duganella sp. OV458]SDJ61630.1 oxygen-independent coproporphyrinogen-3 oxidase [Duganella sp. OV510]
MIPLIPSVEFDAALVRKLNQMGPRYTSYPTADRFSGDFGAEQYRAAVARLDGLGERAPFSLYVHIPFCESLCYYCGCNKIITQDKTKSAEYLSYLSREMALQAEVLGERRKVDQLHFGGGTPTYLSDAQMDGLLGQLRAYFDFAPDEVGEFSIEVDPRTVTPERIAILRRQGFNRISLGIQDFDPAVQKAVNRIQSYEQTMDVLKAARTSGFRSISVDLIYGLPLQSVESFGPTLDKVVAARPDRIAVYNYAHMPQLFKAQRLIKSEELPDPEAKLAMLGLCIERLTAAGYVYIGMDHFALPEDDLARSQREGKLQRNFQGYSTHADAPMVALGVSAISAVGNSYSQNEKVLSAYYERLDAGELPIVRGITLNEDDVLRRTVIGRLMCDFVLDYDGLPLPQGVTPQEYFAEDLARLRPLEDEGLLCEDSSGIKVKMRGRLMIRNICMAFDNYLNAPKQEGPQPARYSKTI